MTHGLTPRQRDTLTVIQSYEAEHGCTPTYRDIERDIGVVSTSTIHGLVKQLEARGFIQRIPNRARSISLVKGEAA